MTILTIGRLAKAAGVNIETIRYYQRLELIIEPAKPPTGYRQYPHQTIERIHFIKAAQQLGFSLKEIQQLLALGSSHCADIQALATEKRQRIQRQIEGLLTIQSVLDQMIDNCQHQKPEQDCAFISALSQKGLLKQE
jgi:MerR family mercuric resistance operon transcriptional regulator